MNYSGKLAEGLTSGAGPLKAITSVQLSVSGVYLSTPIFSESMPVLSSSATARVLRTGRLHTDCPGRGRDLPSDLWQEPHVRAEVEV